MVVGKAQAHGADRLRRFPLPRLGLAESLAPPGLGVPIPLPRRDIGNAVGDPVPLVDDRLVAVEAPPPVQPQVNMHPVVGPGGVLTQDGFAAPGGCSLQEFHPCLVGATGLRRDEADEHVLSVHPHPLYHPPVEEGGRGLETPLRGRGRDGSPDEKLVEGSG